MNLIVILKNTWESILMEWCPRSKNNWDRDWTYVHWSSDQWPFEFFFLEVSFVYQTTGEVLSFGLELFVQTNRLKLSLFSSNRLDLKIISVHQNDSGLYSCFNHHDELSSFILQVLSKSLYSDKINSNVNHLSLVQKKKKTWSNSMM